VLISGVETNMLRNNESLSNLLDDQCASADLDDLLKNEKTLSKWYRYQAVSAVLKDQHSADANFDFCQAISAKIAEEPAMIAIPAESASEKSTSEKLNNKSAEVISFRRFGGGFAIAASAAFATFFSVQSLQVSSELSPSERQTAEITTSNTDNSVSDFAIGASPIYSHEQNELEFFNNLYLQEVSRSENVAFEQVGGVYAGTLRISAEQWQQLLQRAVQQRSKIESANLEADEENSKQ